MKRWIPGGAPSLADVGKHRKPSKFKNHRFHADGFWWQSKAEYERWLTLRLLEKGRAIRNLERQVRIALVSNGVPLGIDYVADFVYEEPDRAGAWQQVVEDSKGARTELYRLKRALLRTQGIVIRETGAGRTQRGSRA